MPSPAPTTPWVPLWPVAPLPSRVRIPVRLRVPRSSTLGGNTSFTVGAMTAHDMAMWVFANNVEGRVHGYVLLPITISAIPAAEIRLVTTSSVASGNLRWKVATKSVADGQSLNPATLTAETIQTIVNPGTWISKEVIFPITEVLASRGILMVEVTRDGANAGDTAEGDAYVIEAYLEANIGA